MGGVVYPEEGKKEGDTGFTLVTLTLKPRLSKVFLPSSSMRTTMTGRRKKSVRSPFIDLSFSILVSWDVVQLHRVPHLHVSPPHAETSVETPLVSP